MSFFLSYRLLETSCTTDIWTQPSWLQMASTSLTWQPEVRSILIRGETWDLWPRFSNTQPPTNCLRERMSTCRQWTIIYQKPIRNSGEQVHSCSKKHVGRWTRLTGCVPRTKAMEGDRNPRVTACLPVAATGRMKDEGKEQARWPRTTIPTPPPPSCCTESFLARIYASDKALSLMWHTHTHSI